MLTKYQINKIKKEIVDNRDRMPVILAALGDQNRFRIFKLLIDYHDLCVTDIAKIFDMTISAASQQLRTLEMLDLVRKIRMGRVICYELKKDSSIVKQLIQFIRSNN